MKLTVISVGKLKEAYWRDAVDEYKKRVARLEIIELPDEPAGQNPSQKEIEKIKAVEGEKILEAIPKNAYIYALCIEGREMDSVAFANHLKKLTMNYSHFVFIIGGSHGLSDEVISRANMKLSFSKFTFPHQMMRVILVEQIYRAITIQNGLPYHK